MQFPEEKYRLMVNYINEGILVTEEGMIKFVNPKGVELTGYLLDELLSEPLIKLVHPGDQDKFTKRHDKQLRGESVPPIYVSKFINKKCITKWMELNTTLFNWDGKPALLYLFRDITRRKQEEEALRDLSFKDDLTGLYSRRGLFSLAAQNLKTAQRMGKRMSIIFGDVEKMKEINDTFGHQEGDRVLIDIAHILKKTFRESDIIARMGGDEFVILAMDTLEASTEKLISRFEKILNDYNLQRVRPFQLSMDLGVAYFEPQYPSSLETLLSRADKIMYENKNKKKRKPKVD